MVVESVRVLDLRNLAPCEVEFGPRLNLLWGPNGAGKTNLLEATYMALAGRSCRTRDDREAIAFGRSLARAEARLVERRAASGERRAAFLFSISRAQGRRHLLDGSPVGPDAPARRPPLAVFMPDRLALVKGPPAGRRTHLDGFCAALWPGRDEVRRRYTRALSQRNALLGRIRAGATGTATLDSWDAELAAAGIELAANRADAAARLASPFAEAGAALGLGDSASLAYRSRTGASDAGQFAAELAGRRESDIGRGYTSWGPHHDELALELAGRSLRRYGSQGQQRTALLALLFAERRALIDSGRPPPLMLLDDVTSELDPDRRRLLIEHLADGGGQTLATATEPGELPAGARDRRDIAIRAGRPLGPAPATEERAA